MPDTNHLVAGFPNLGCPGIHPRTLQMQRSGYLKKFPCHDDPGRFIVFSMKRGSIVRLSEETWDKMENGGLSSSEEAMFLRLEMITPDREAEKRSVWETVDRQVKKKSAVNTIIVLNLDCNFSCSYCFEKDIKGKKYMSDETAKKSADFVKSRLSPGKTGIYVTFYGGEPLLSLKRIEWFSKNLRRHADTMNVDYGFGLVTNGSLLNKKNVEFLLELGLKKAKVTLDGPPEIHDRKRPFKSGRGSFNAILKNLRDVCGILRIEIGGNYDQSDFERFPELLDCLENNDLPPDRLAEINFDPVMEMAESGVCRGGYVAIDDPWVERADALLRKEILKRGYDMPKPLPIFCVMEDTDDLIVNFDGTIYRCPIFLGIPGFSIGNVDTGVSDPDNVYGLGRWKNDECLECMYLPFCFGGCGYMAYLRHGTANAADCRKDFLERHIETIVRQEVKYRKRSK